MVGDNLRIILKLGVGFKIQWENGVENIGIPANRLRILGQFFVPRMLCWLTRKKQNGKQTCKTYC